MFGLLQKNKNKDGIGYFDNKASCSICNKDLSLKTLRSRFQLADGWLCSDCIKLAGGYSNLNRKKDTIEIVKEKIRNIQKEKNKVKSINQNNTEYQNIEREINKIKSITEEITNIQKKSIIISKTKKNTSNKLAEKIMKYQSYNPYLKDCDDKDVKKACKNCNCLKDVYHTAIEYIEKDNSPTSVYLLAKANFGLGVLYTERTIHYGKKYLELPQKFKTKEEKNQKNMEICNMLADCFKKDYLIEEELKYRELTLQYSVAWWTDYKKKLPYPQPMESYENKGIRKRITELKDDIKTSRKIEKETGKKIDLSKPLTNRKVLKRIDINTDTVYNLITGEIVE